MREKKESERASNPQPRDQPGVGSWRGIAWRVLEQELRERQQGIYQASKRGERRTVHRLQQQLLESEAARLLAVRRATEENDGKDTAGIDGVKSLTPEERLMMASTIHPAS